MFLNDKFWVGGVTLTILVSGVGCPDRSQSVGTAATARPAIPGLPIRIKVKQRTTSDVPGTGGNLRLTIDDVTGGQVMTSLGSPEGAALFGPVSIRTGDTKRFQFAGQQFTLTLDRLDNVLVGDDAAQFTIDQPGPNRMSEQAKIERLIAGVRSTNGLTFLRNGQEHTPEEAADHLRRKWQATGDIETARQFIDVIGTKSSASGEVYRIRLPDGTTMLASEYLFEQLRSME
jgi:hypothetical protein